MEVEFTKPGIPIVEQEIRKPAGPVPPIRVKRGAGRHRRTVIKPVIFRIRHPEISGNDNVQVLSQS